MSASTPVTHRTWVSPIAAVAFLAVAITGILMLFHVKLPAIKNLHEWIGVLFAAAGILHLILNWKLLLSYFTKKVGLAAAACALLICLALAIFHGPPEHHGGGDHEDGRPSSQMETH